MAQNKNGPIIGLAIFSVLSVVFAVFWYMTFSDNQAKTAQLLNAVNKQKEIEGTVNDLNAQIAKLKELVGTPNADVGHGDPAQGTVAGEVNAMLARLSGDGTPAPNDLLNALSSTASKSSKNLYTADDRKRQRDAADNQHQQAIAAKDLEIQKFQDAVKLADEKLVSQEVAHNEEMKKKSDQIEALRQEKATLQADYAALETRTSREIEDLQSEIAEQKRGLVGLRSLLRKKEDPTFSKPDGVITSVDHNEGLAFLDIGSEDGLRTGVTFSVYTQNHTGVGRANTDDIKGKIEVVEIMGPRRSKARIVSQDQTRPVMDNDPVFSPIFQAGQSLEVVVAGKIRMDGVDREAFRRMVRAAGAKIAVEIADDGQFTDGRGEVISEEEAKKRITARTRYLVIGDVGETSSTSDDTGQEQRNMLIRKNKGVLEDQAENLGIYPIGLSSFLEHIGYNRKQIAWTPENGQPFPSHLTGGALSSSAGSHKGVTSSNNAISGAYSGSTKPSLISGGTTSKAYSN